MRFQLRNVFSRILLVCVLGLLWAGSASGQIITGFEPAFAATNEQVRIDGAGFTGVTTVQFFNNKNVAVTPVADNQILVTVPANAATGPIGVSRPGSGFVYSSQDFVVIGPGPFITSSPQLGAPGSVVDIFGVHFTGVTSVKFNGVSASFAPPTTDTQIQVTVPLTGTTGPITVTSPRGTATSTNYFFYPPSITSFTPSAGTVGTTVVITGKNFLGANSVRFNSVAAPATVNSGTQITVKVPTNAIIGPITISGPAGSDRSASNFVVRPVIYGFTPTVGPIGTVVTITGANLDEGRTGAPVLVKFNGVAAVNPTLSPSQITAVVPSGATTGPISVTTTNGTFSTTSNFVVAAVSDLTLNLGGSPNPVSVGADLTLTMSVTNRGPSMASGVVISNPIPASFAIQSVTTSRGTYTTNGNRVVVNSTDLSSNATVLVTVNLHALQPGVFTDTATVSSGLFDPQPQNDSASIDITVLPLPGLSVIRSGNQVILSWPAALTNYVLQANDVLGSSNTWTTVSPPPVTSGSERVVTNSITGQRRFFRLKR